MRCPRTMAPAKLALPLALGYLVSQGCTDRATFQLNIRAGSSRPQDDDGANKTLSSAEQQNPDGSSGESREDRELQPPEGIDLLAGMPEADKWGIKGLKTLMNNHSDYQAMVIGLDHGTLGLDVNSPE